ncbi:hypothetical protein M0R45_009658 [Rubus argutus]|uniref:Trichome birefringence-like C-terminal domain-containing protein n=1 Tax=Rubus argutus TaxID=59490 RepID=A0AAW1Y549_RUBAR
MDRSPVSDTSIKVVRKMAVPVTVIHITPMGAFRSDVHVGAWSDKPSVPDCSHWCLPGHLGYLICGMRFSRRICNHEIANMPPPFAAAINYGTADAL